MQRACDSCGVDYEAKRPSSRFCSPRCRQRAQRGHLMRLPEPAPEPTCGALHAATLAELTAAAREDTALGVAALAAAARIDSGQDTGSGIASLLGRWQALMTQATDGAKPSSHVDELREKRAARRSG